MRWNKLVCFGMAAVLSCSSFWQMPAYAQEDMEEKDKFEENNEYVTEESLGEMGTEVEEKRPEDLSKIQREDVISEVTKEELPEIVPENGGLQEASQIIPEEDIKADNTTEEGYKYKELDDGTLEITGYTGTNTELVIPAEIGGKRVTNIGHDTFFNCSSLESVTIPEGITNIGYLAFAFCKNLVDVTISSGVISIEESAFSNCTNLVDVTIPKSVISIGSRAFAETCWLKNKRQENPLVIVNNILIDGYECKGNVSIPKSVIRI